MKQLNAPIMLNKQIAPRVYRMRIESAYLAKHIAPGQFIEARCSDGYDPLLRRPFSAHRIMKDGIEILYEVVGRGTELLARKQRGDTLDVIGPLGHGFDLQTPDPCLPADALVAGPQTPILVGGGIGAAPLLALAEKIGDHKEICVLIGAKTKADLLCEDDFKKIGAKVSIATDDGSKGKKGFVTDLLEYSLQTTNYKLPTTIYACGPVGMLKEVARLAKQHDIPCQVSLEECMACGVGVCLGCPVKVRTNYKLLPDEARRAQAGQTTNYDYKMVCKDGPVFDAAEVVW